MWHIVYREKGGGGGGERKRPYMGGREHGRCLTHLAVIALHHQAPFSFSFFSFRFESGGGWESMRALSLRRWKRMGGGEFSFETWANEQDRWNRRRRRLLLQQRLWALHRGLSPRPWQSGTPPESSPSDCCCCCYAHARSLVCRDKQKGDLLTLNKNQSKSR